MTRNEYLEEISRVKNNMENIEYLLKDMIDPDDALGMERAILSADELIRLSIYRLNRIVNTEVVNG